MTNTSKLIWPMLLMAIAVGGCGSKDKDKYRMSEQTPADYITWQRGPGDVVEHDEARCEPIAPFEGTAFEYLEAIVKAGHRRSGTREYRCAAGFVRDAFEHLGYDVREFTYHFPYYQFDPEEVKVTRLRDGKEFPAYPMHYSMPTGVVRVGRLKRPRGNLTGCFVYVEGGLLSSGDLKENYEKWRQRGALGIVMEADLRPLATRGLIHSRGAHSRSFRYAPLPGFVVANAKDLLGETIEVRQNARIVRGQGVNVVAKTEPRNGRYILVTAHLDSWFEGALDDGSGVAAALEVARLLRDDPDGVIFLIVDSEEIGLVGSGAYVLDAGVDDIAGVVELDMVSTLNNYFSRDPATAGVMPRVISVTRGLRPVSRRNLGSLPGRKVHVGVGLNRAVFGGLATDMEWYYTRGVPGIFIYTPSYYYHTERDVLEWIPADDIQQVAEATAGLVRELRSQAESLPAPAGVIPFDFAVRPTDGESISLEVEIDDPAMFPLPAYKVRVYCYLAQGLEQDVDLEKGAGGIFRGETVLSLDGDWQFLAVVSRGDSVGKRWARLDQGE